jgi:Transglycosylase SLT domain/Bacterial SH3 domain
MPSERETYEPIAREAARSAGIDPELFVRQITHESGWDPDAGNPSGAQGLAQIIGRLHPDVNPRDPIASLEYAADWMARLHREYGSYRKALAAYHWGPGNVAEWDGRRKTVPAETRRYLDAILGARWPEPASATTRRTRRAAAGSTSTTRTGKTAAGSTSTTRTRRAADGPAPKTRARRAPAGSAPTTRTRRAAASRPSTTPTRRAGAGSVSAPGQLRVTENAVRLRAEPSTSAEILTELDAGTIVTPTSPYPWRLVRVGGEEGWIAATFLETTDAMPAPPPPPSPPPPTRFPFDANTPTELQVQDWTCSIRSTMWMLKSIGIAVTPAEAQDAMSPRYCNSAVGLLDATGAGVVEVLRDCWGVAAFNRAPVSFDEVAGWAGTRPVMIGGRNWGHWTAVRGFDGERLVLANPGGTGPRFGQQTLNRQQFEDLGWFSAVVIPVE